MPLEGMFVSAHCSGDRLHFDSLCSQTELPATAGSCSPPAQQQTAPERSCRAVPPLQELTETNTRPKERRSPQTPTKHCFREYELNHFHVTASGRRIKNRLRGKLQLWAAGSHKHWKTAEENRQLFKKNERCLCSFVHVDNKNDTSTPAGILTVWKLPV